MKRPPDEDKLWIKQSLSGTFVHREEQNPTVRHLTRTISAVPHLLATDPSIHSFHICKVIREGGEWDDEQFPRASRLLTGSLTGSILTQHQREFPWRLMAVGGILQLAARMVGGVQRELSMRLNIQEGH